VEKHIEHEFMFSESNFASQRRHTSCVMCHEIHDGVLRSESRYLSQNAEIKKFEI